MPHHGICKDSRGIRMDRLKRRGREKERIPLWKWFFSSHAEVLADTSWTKGFVYSLDKQETSRSLTSSLSLSLSIINIHKNNQTQTVVLYSTDEDNKVYATELVHIKVKKSIFRRWSGTHMHTASSTNSYFNKKDFHQFHFHFMYLQLVYPFHISIQYFASSQSLPCNQALFPGASMITPHSSKNLQGLILTNSYVFGYLIWGCAITGAWC